MCTGIEIAMLATAAVGTVSGVASAQQQAKSVEQMSEYNQQIAKNDAIAAQQKADYDEAQLRRRAMQLRGTQRATAAQQGGELLDMQDVFDMTTEQEELDALAIQYGGKMGVASAQQRGGLARLEGNVARQRAQSAAGKSLLTGAKSVVGYYS